MKLTIVTGANKYYFKSLCQLLNNINNTLYNYNLNLYIYDLGIDEIQINELFNNLNSFNKNITYNYLKFDYSKYPSYYNIYEKKGEYAWKSACIWQTYKNIDSDILMWCDSANLFTTSSIDTLINIIKEQGIYSPSSKHTVREWTHNKCLEYFNIENDNIILNLQQRSGGMLCFDLNNISTHSVIKEFYNLSKIKECIAPDGSNILNHRQDQALFTILYYNYTNMKELENECICFEFHKYKHQDFNNKEFDENDDTNNCESFSLNKCSLNTWKDIIKPMEQLIIHSVDPDDNDYFTLTSIGYNYIFLNITNDQDILKYQYGTHSETVLCCFDEEILLNSNNINSKLILENLKKNGIINKKLNKEEYYSELPKHKYVIIPELDKIDNHLYYEALIAGCIPIVIESNKSYVLSCKYGNVPFLYTKDYSDINIDNLNNIYDFLSNKVYNFSKLLLYGLNDVDYNDCLERTNKMFQSLQNN
jgi:hypothetical protein